MYRIEQTEVFKGWLAAVRDVQAKIHISRRVRRLGSGNAGDAKGVGDQVAELRIHSGPGYRVYFTLREGAVVLLLAGGDKSTQAADIRLAKKLALEV